MHVEYDSDLVREFTCECVYGGGRVTVNFKIQFAYTEKFTGDLKRDVPMMAFPDT